MIRFYNVTKVYANDNVALDNVTLHIGKGEFVFLVGPSGAGKTTLGKLIFREELPTRGQIIFNGKSFTRMRSKDVPFHRRKIGMVFQDFRLLPQKTVYENVSFALEVAGASPKEIKKRVPGVLGLVNLENKANKYPHQLSGGEQQRNCVARALVNNPFLLIADEPTGNLDPGSSRDLMAIFEKINAQGATIIMATHAWDIVDEMKKRVVELVKGRIKRDEESGAYKHGS